MSDLEAEYRLEYFKEEGFERKECPSCGVFFWTRDHDRETCGEPPCASYDFIDDPGFDDEYTLSTGSSSSMLAALDRAVALDQPIVVTLWEPHPAYGRYELRNLDDPRGALGAPERIDVLATPGFGERHPDVARWLEAFELDEDALSSLQLRLEASADGDERQAVADWVAEHREEVDGWLGR